ncbi:MAG TPA: hypothetical protein VFF16_18445 [Telluria sp.]|nr:hypothetical protein [Telluria sp.]
MRTWLFVMLTACGAAQAQAPKPACGGPEHRQFDFWVGRWDVFNPAGKKVGESWIEPFANGCGIEEHWQSTNGVSGRSLNMYDASDRQWHQAWVDSSGSRLLLDGALVDGKMVLARGQRDRVTWSVNPDGSVRQHWEASKDGGATWATSFDGGYVKRP